MKNKKENQNPIKVYLQYPWRFPDSPYYKYLLANTPEGIEYLNVKKQKGVITNKKVFWLSNFLKRNIRRFFFLSRTSIPNAHLTRAKNRGDLIHCAHCLSLNRKTPWVADIECGWQMYVGKSNKISKFLVGKILKRKNCKKILPWTETTAQELVREFPEIKNKIEVVYPALPIPKLKKREHSGINLIFVARYFEAKGGYTALKVIDNLTKEYKNVRGIFVSEIPKEILEKYSKNKKITFYGLMPQSELFEKVYSVGDILVYPGYSDSFGFAFLESMSFGIPIVTVEGFARKELVEPKKTGFVFGVPKITWTKKGPIIENEQDLIKKISSQVEVLIKNKNLIKKMSKNCINEVKEGKFSIKQRNTKLKKIYRESIK